ncbi:hypothetical protein V9K09_003507 [Vibrio cholerae]|uniref:hypothetical protein n=1 Tax=Vibrio cholerae TaxID=666 RepID=UPI0022730463|nr:hypothetical protein [Vibrio cholerae]EGR0900748.1 hypothetical protein [Vibrio cholerae]EGR4436933.1 hypothetical protein [Vibrio cholerae]EJL6378883.1 hypothetical protein [Vibrio cholerae]EKE8763178.1 hypothetical protein [Vibrio cholerae]ELI3479341.1 hypothetical protein [Vibrio cholerae]
MKNFDYPSGVVFIALVVTCIGFGYMLGTSSIGNSLFGSFIFSLFSSFVFFFLTTKLSENRNQKRINRVIYPKLKELVDQVEYAVETCIFNEKVAKGYIAANADIDTVSRWLERGSALDVSIDRSNGIIQYPNCKYEPKTYKDLLVIYTVIPVIEYLGELKPYYFAIDKDILDCLAKINSAHYLRITGKELIELNDILFIPPHFIEFWSLVRELHNRIEYLKM